MKVPNKAIFFLCSKDLPHASIAHSHWTVMWVVTLATAQWLQSVSDVSRAVTPPHLEAHLCSGRPMAAWNLTKWPHALNFTALYCRSWVCLNCTRTKWHCFEKDWVRMGRDAQKEKEFAAWAWWHTFVFENPYKCASRDVTPWSWPLTYTCMSWHTYAHIHTCSSHTHNKDRIHGWVS